MDMKYNTSSTVFYVCGNFEAHTIKSAWVKQMSSETEEWACPGSYE